MRRSEARSAGIECPAGVTRLIQVSLYNVEPSEAVLAANLFANDEFRATLADKPEEVRPEVPLVSKPASLACRAERLAWAGCGPDGAIVGPSGAAEREGPHANAGEEVALGVPVEVGGSNIDN